MLEELTIIFLGGPPGVGKSTHGRHVCAELGLRFVDVGELTARSEGLSPRQALDQVVVERSADVVELPWDLQLDTRTMKDCRRAGTLTALWAHPLDMQARSGRAEPLFTPGRSGLTTYGGFGRLGTSCLEYRRLNRACEVVLNLVGMSEDEATQELITLIVELRQEPSGSPAEQEGLDSWGRYWKKEFRANPGAVQVLLDAMARFLQHLDQQGVSPRMIRGIADDLQALGLLTFYYDSPKPATVLESLSADTYGYGCKFSDATNAVTRYQKSVEKFRRFLAEQGLVEPDEDEEN